MAVGLVIPTQLTEGRYQCFIVTVSAKLKITGAAILTRVDGENVSAFLP